MTSHILPNSRTLPTVSNTCDDLSPSGAEGRSRQAASGGVRAAVVTKPYSNTIKLLKRYLDNHCQAADQEGMSALCECRLCLETRQFIFLWDIGGVTMPGKYAHVIPGLPRELGTEPAYQTKVNAAKAVIRSEPDFKLHASALAKRYLAIRREKDLMKEQLSEVDLRLTAVTQLLADQYEVEGTSSVKLEDDSSVSIVLEPHASVFDRDALRAWAIEQGLERSLALPPMTVIALTKERLLQGLSEPDGVKAAVRSKIVYRR
jgi:hypothetical protein